MPLKEDKSPLQNRKAAEKKALLAEQRAAALKANLKRRKEQTHARQVISATNQQDDI